MFVIYLLLLLNILDFTPFKLSHLMYTVYHSWADPDGGHRGHVPPPNQRFAEVVGSGRLDSKMH